MDTAIKKFNFKTLCLNLLSLLRKSYILFLCSALLLIVSWVFKGYLQASMSLHMLVHIPLIILAGIAASSGIRRSVISQNEIYSFLALKLKAYNELGVSGFLFIALTSMYWMMPKALDQVLVSEYAQLSKYLSLFMVGLILPWSYQKSHTVVRLFFIGSICWAMAIVGMLYQEADVRLCNFYLLNDQQITGIGLVILAIVIPTCWITLEALQYRRITPKQA